MICPRCQSQVADGVKFCGVCGSPIQVSQTPPPVSPTPPPAQPQSQYGAPQGAYIPPNQYEEYSSNQALGSQVPRAELHNPKGPLQVGDMTITIDGQLVPVADVMLGGQIPIYFEHHILLWKHPGVQIGFKSLRGMAKRFFAGIQIFLTEA
ncbi:MAG TPA: zinc-ribbon domain-containing protein, partial [Ktedonobacteraceae bacterium]|nr:zinc-ribbon domain-containing protein [Ktedonobacteraceae bacterium]